MKKTIISLSIILFVNISAQNPAGNLLQFDGNDYVNCGNNSSLNWGSSNFTVSAWVKRNTTGITTNSYQVFVGKQESSGNYRGWYIRFGLNNKVEFACNYGVWYGNGSILSTYAISDTDWHHYSGVFDGSNGLIKLYIDGQMDTSAIGSNTYDINNNTNLYIARKKNGEYFYGQIDEVRIWNIARDSSQINATMNDTLSTDYYSNSDSSLVAYWRFDEGIGSTTDDLTLNNNNGSIVGASFVVSDAPLPVELSSFTVKETNNLVVLNWQTATEVNNYGFSVQRKTTTEWEEISFIDGHGNSNSPNEYSFVDNDNLSGIVKYRLKQIDIDGSFEYSDVVEVEISSAKEFKLSQNYPNPFNPTTMVSYTLPTDSKVKIEVTNMLGQSVRVLVNDNKSAGHYEATWNAENLPSGIYFINITANGINSTESFTQVKKALLLK